MIVQWRWILYPLYPLTCLKRERCAGLVLTNKETHYSATINTVNNAMNWTPYHCNTTSGVRMCVTYRCKHKAKKNNGSDNYSAFPSLWYIFKDKLYGSIHSNKSTNQLHQSLRFIARRSNTAQYISGLLLPIIRSL